MSKNKKSNKTVLFLTPVSVFAVCAALIAGAGYVPFTKIMNTSNVIFSASVPQEEIGKIKYDTKEVEDVLDDGSKIVYPSF